MKSCHQVATNREKLPPAPKSCHQHRKVAWSPLGRLFQFCQLKSVEFCYKIFNGCWWQLLTLGGNFSDLVTTVRCWSKSCHQHQKVAWSPFGRLFQFYQLKSVEFCYKISIGNFLKARRRKVATNSEKLPGLHLADFFNSIN